MPADCAKDSDTVNGPSTATTAPAGALIFACRLDGQGGAAPLGWDDIPGSPASGDAVWVHLDHQHPGAFEWLSHNMGLGGATCEALLAEQTRPRSFKAGTGTVVILRGINFNEGSDAEDMVALRIWCDGSWLITLRHEPLRAARELHDTLLLQSSGPTTVPELFDRLISGINEPIGEQLMQSEEEIDDLEIGIDPPLVQDPRAQLSSIRQRAVLLRRYIIPQREAIATLAADPPPWFGAGYAARMREDANRLTRYIEELDAIRDRALVVKDDLTHQMSEQTGKILYRLAVLSAIFLPLSFITGLLGVNLGGIPGSESEGAFWIFSGALLVFLLIEAAIFRKLKWL